MVIPRVPPISPYGLLQESLWPNEWMILVSCMMLNCTSRKQVEKILPEFILRWPDPKTFLAASPDEVAALCKSLGFANRRTQNMLKMTQEYVSGAWHHARQLTGIGEYAARAWEIFCRGTLGNEPPKDHALVQYWHWHKRHHV